MNAQQIAWLPEEVRNHIAQLERDLARLTAENERLENLAATLAANLAKASKRNAELVEQLKAYGKYAHDTTLEDQNDELVAALTDIHSAAMVDGFAEEAPDMVCKIRELAAKALTRAESATCQKATNPSQISSESAEPVMGGLPRYDGEKLGTPAKQQSAS